MDFPDSSAGKESACNAGDPLIPGSESSSGEGIGYPLQYSWASLVAQIVKNLPAMQEAWVQSLGWEDALKKGTATHPSILAWRIPWREEPGELQSMGLQRVGYNWATVTFTFKITVDSNCSHEIKRHLLLGRKVMTNLDNILKNRDSTLVTKVYIAKAMVFPVVMHGRESWTMKKAEHGRTEAFELWS